MKNDNTVRPVEAYIPPWEDPIVRFLRGNSEILLGESRVCATLFEILGEHVEEENYSLRIEGRVITMEEMRAAAIIIMFDAWDMLGPNLHIDSYELPCYSVWNALPIGERRKIYETIFMLHWSLTPAR